METDRFEKKFELPGTKLEVVLVGQPFGRYNSPEGIAEVYSNGGIREVLDVINQSWNGSYGVVIKDDTTVFAFTDPHGIEQLYYCTVPEFRISPYIDGLPHHENKMDKLYLSEIRKWGYNTDDRTPWLYTKRVMPGELIQADLFRERVFRTTIFEDYFNMNDPEYLDKLPKEHTLAEELKARVHKAVLDRVNALPKDTKQIAMLLSGGLDSSCIASELIGMQKEGLLGDLEIKFYTINNADDAPFVKDFAKMYGIDVTTLSYDMNNVDLKEAIRINEMPVDLGSMVPNQKMFEVIPETIIFTGDGPDEMLGGYNRIDQYDSQLSDTFEELSFYHYPRLNKAAKHFDKDLVCPYTDRYIVELAMNVPFAERTHKKILKDAYRGLIPDSIIARQKLPLKNDELRKDPIAYRFKVVDTFVDMYKN